MWQITLFLTVMLAGQIDIVVSQLPCDSPLRILRPQLFLHCSCFYGSWSRWERINHMVHSTSCSSGYLHTVKRIRKDINGACKDDIEKDYHCAPTVEDASQIIIRVLDLHHPLTVEQPLHQYSKRKRQTMTTDTQLCNHDQKSSDCKTQKVIDEKRKRSSNMIREKVYPPPEVVTAQLDDGIIPKPFNVDEYLCHFKRHHKTRSSRQTTPKNRYALFILDGSGSIGSTNFKKMTTFVADLSFIFQHCGFTAVMTFNGSAYIEYNFHCYEDSISTEIKDCMVKKINKISYPDGWTQTGNAIKMAHKHLLSDIAKDAGEIDVIIITDGRSNSDPCSDAKETWENPNLKGKIHVFSIGIGSRVNHTQLYCLMGGAPEFDNPLHVLNFTTLENINVQILLDVSTQTQKFCARFDNFQEIICEYSEDFLIATTKP